MGDVPIQKTVDGKLNAAATCCNAESINITNKDISNISEKEAIGYLDYMQSEYSNLITKEISLGTIWESSMSELDNKSEVEQFQEKLINKIIWKWNTSWNIEWEWYIKSYYPTRWFYLITEKQIIERYQILLTQAQQTLGSQ